MPQRNELNIRARAVGLDPTGTAWPNDSKLEQKVLWLEKRVTAFTGTLGSGTLTNSGTQSTTGDTTVIGSVTYTWRTALTEAAATSTLTSNNTTPTDGDYVTVGGFTYTFRTALTNGGTAPYEVLINGSADGALAKLKLAILATGTPGTDYGIGTIVNPQVTVGSLTSHTLPMTALAIGTLGNQILTSAKSASTTLTWTGTTFTGGVNPIPNEVLLGVSVATSMANLNAAITGTTGVGTTFSTGTATHPQVTATHTATTVVVTAIDYAITNASIPTTNPIDTGSYLSWGATTLASGAVNVIADTGGTDAGATGVSGDANTYSGV